MPSDTTAYTYSYVSSTSSRHAWAVDTNYIRPIYERYTLYGNKEQYKIYNCFPGLLGSLAR
jgi:hypothetical protein